ncbi:unnamed protein product [Ilex paraguariensis]|uniref:SS18 N-terminal domain-containing protein n=1 Tax=Ilex paraguariensis TaxID=185542 RepID=A0ABC8SMX3_9AQUA
MQQPQHPTLNSTPPLPSNTITTEQIQKYLDENKQLILAILENQNLGKLAECAQYQALLQRNLMYLAAIADAQPQGSTLPSQMAPQSVLQPGNYMQQTQAAAPQQHQGVPGPRLPFQHNALRPQDQQQQLLHFQQQQQLLQGHLGLRSNANNGMHQAMQPGLGTSGSSADARGSKQDGSEAGSGDRQGRSASGRGNREDRQP